MFIFLFFCATTETIPFTRCLSVLILFNLSFGSLYSALHMKGEYVDSSTYLWMYLNVFVDIDLQGRGGKGREGEGRSVCNWVGERNIWWYTFDVGDCGAGMGGRGKVYIWYDDRNDISTWFCIDRSRLYWSIMLPRWYNIWCIEV